MQTIDAINEMIGYVGETPVDSTDSDYTQHPLYESALRILTSTSRIVQSRGWWFNTRPSTLTPDGTGAIALDASILSVAVDDRYGVAYAVRGNAMYDMTHGTATIGQPLSAVIRELVAFSDLPESAANYITQYASVRFVQTYDGDRSKLSEVKENSKAAYLLFNADDINESNVNLFATRSMGPVMATAWHQRYRIR